jgi:hypothetical protein
MFGSVDIKTRPLKLAFLVDPNSSKQVREAIRLSSTLWGGVYFPIIQLYKRMPKTWQEKPIKTPSSKSVILGYIEAFDPDVFVQLSKNIPCYISESGIKIIKPEYIWRDIGEDGNLTPRFGIGLFEILNEIFKQDFRFTAKYPIRIIFPELPKEHSLFWASFFGDIPSKLTPLLKEHYYKPLEINTPNFKIENIDELVAGNVLFPRRITYYGISSLSRSGFRGDAYVFFMDATKVEDVVDYWNLRAMGRSVIPAPIQLEENPKLREIVIGFLKAHRKHWRHDPQHCDYASIIRARSCTMAEMQKYAKTLKIEPSPKDTSSDPFFALQHWYPRVWDEWARDKDGAVPSDIFGEEEESIDIADAKETRIRFRSLLPKFAQKYGYHGEPRCANEIRFRFYGAVEYIAEVFPKSSGDNFIRAISGLTSFSGDWRVGRNGLVKLVEDDFNETKEIPLSEKVFFAWLEDLGWKPKLSAPGLLAKQIYKRLEGYPSILKNEKLLGLLEHMNGGSVQQDGRPIGENKINQERDLSVGEVKNRLEAGSQKRNPHDYLIKRGVFRLGLRIQCPHCLRKSWYPLESIRDSFTCPKCLDVFNAVGKLDSSTWSYKTTGPFSVANYAEGAYAVLLTLDFLDGHKLTGMRITPTTSFIAEAHDRKKLEADFAAFWQDSVYGEKNDGLLFGECKTYGKFKNADFERMRYLANTFPGSVLVFSTLRKSLTQQEMVSITRIAKKGREYWKLERPINPVMILTGNELLHDFGPPYCWEDSNKKNLSRARGLLSVCDTTQQIYLNLRSWQAEWHEKWEKKRQKRMAKKRNKEN